MKNWYNEIDKKLLPERKTIKGCEKTGIKYSPYFLLISGRSGLGKTNALIELLHRQNGSFDKVILCCMSFASDPLYVSMKMNNPTSFDVYEKEVPSPDLYLGDKGSKLFIVDDMVGNKKFAPAINEWFIRGRKAGSSMIYITQSFFDVPTLVRRSLSSLFLFSSNSKSELNLITSNYPFLKDMTEELVKYRNIKVNEGTPSSFLNINIQAGTACIDFELYDTKAKHKTSRRT